MSKKKTDIKTGWLVREEIGFLSLESPPENYLENPEFISQAELKELVETSSIRGLVISGEGRNFSAGAKLDTLYKLAGDKEDLGQNLTHGKSLLSYIENLDIPVIAAVNGICFGGGLEIALAAHIRICSRNALFAFPETNHEMMPGLGGTVRGSHTSGFPAMVKMVLGGDVVNAEEALEMKLVDKISDNDPGEDAFVLLKKMTTDKPLKVIRSVMQALRNAQRLSPAEAMREETKLFCELASDEALRRKQE
jgi:enoyl-CoA hydratase/carnithine racemase